MLEGQFWHIRSRTSDSRAGEYCSLIHEMEREVRGYFWRDCSIGAVTNCPPQPQSPVADCWSREECTYERLPGIRERFLGGARWKRIIFEPMLELSNMPSRGCILMKGFEYLRPATLGEQQTLYIRSVWGLEVIVLLAERYFVRKCPPTRELPWQEHMELLEFSRRYQSKQQGP